MMPNESGCNLHTLKLLNSGTRRGKSPCSGVAVSVSIPYDCSAQHGGPGLSQRTGSFGEACTRGAHIIDDDDGARTSTGTHASGDVELPSGSTEIPLVQATEIASKMGPPGQVQPPGC